jgi:hypothetical protein
MAVPSSIDFRDLNQWIEMHRVVTSPASDATTNIWGRVYPTSDSQADLVIHNGWGFDLFTNTDWQLWYIVYLGYTWLFSIVDIIDGGKLVQIELQTTSSLSTPSLSELDFYNSDTLAASGGVAVGGFYKCDSEHDRGFYGAVTTRLS